MPPSTAWNKQQKNIKTLSKKFGYSSNTFLQNQPIHYHALIWSITQQIVVRLTTTRCVITQKSAVLIYSVAETWNQTMITVKTVMVVVRKACYLHAEPTYPEDVWRWKGRLNTFRPHGVYILRGLSSHQSGAPLNIYSTNIRTEYFKHAA
jgi:hypothetical protein